MVFIGGELTEDNKKYAYGGQFENPQGQAYRNLNRTVCELVSKTHFMTISYHVWYLNMSMLMIG